MNDAQFAELAAWITEAGLAGQSETATLTGFCERAVACGLPLARGIVLVDTLHPGLPGAGLPLEPRQRHHRAH